MPFGPLNYSLQKIADAVLEGKKRFEERLQAETNKDISRETAVKEGCSRSRRSRKCGNKERRVRIRRYRLIETTFEKKKDREVFLKLNITSDMVKEIES